MESTTQLNKVYLSENVYEMAVKRISLVFNGFENIVVSISGGKDSTALYGLVLGEAQKRKRKIKIFFLDQEAEYQSSVDLIEKMMSHPLVEPLWFQVPLKLTNVSSYSNNMFSCWEDGKKWLREKHPMSIHSISEEYPDRFYKFIYWLEKKYSDTAFFIGLRSEESLHRFKAVTVTQGWSGFRWSTKTKGENSYRFYPLYDWSVGDIWKYIHESKIPYNSVYDKMYMANKSPYKNMRVSNLIHEKSFKCLSELQVYEPETFDKIVQRVLGTHVASIYSKEKMVFNSDELPSNFKTWKFFRDYLLATTPLCNRGRFLERFSRQSESEETCRKQVRQIMMNDYEDNLKIKPQKKSKEYLYKHWWNVL